MRRRDRAGRPAAELPVRPRRRPSCRLFLALIIGAVVDGLLFLLFIGIVLFVADLIHAAMRMRPLTAASSGGGSESVAPARSWSAHAVDGDGHGYASWPDAEAVVTSGS